MGGLIMGTTKTTFRIAIAAAAMACAAVAQDSGSITGTVKDSKAGVVPGAMVTVTSADQGVTHTARTNGEGDFSFPVLPPGTYSLAVEVQGFKKSERNAIVVPAATKIAVGDIVLEVGSLTETVTIAADAGELQLQSESGERSNIVTNRQLRDIALNGRNVIDLMRTIPGVLAGGVTANAASTVTNITGGFSVNGTRTAQHEYTVDGVTNLNLGNNTGALVSVNPDALQEVKVLTSNYQAEYGRAGGGFIALTTRGGTNEFHGGARYFRRHDSLNADTYFNNERGGSAAGFPRPLYRYNYYGWDLGGPVVIPKLFNGRNKVFFFIGQEYYNQLVPQASSINILVPTAAERTGDFSRSVDGTGRAISVTDPTTGLPFSGGVIPASRIYGPGKTILNFLPSPNTTAGGNVYNYTSQVPSSYPRDETILRGDWQINSNARLSVRWVYNHDAQQFAYGTTTASWNWPLTVTERRNGPGSIPTISLTNNFGSTISNEFIFGAGRGGVTIAPADDKATRAATGINTPLIFPNANTSSLIPSLTFGGIPSATTALTSVFGTFDQRFSIWHAMDNLSMVVGKHLFKVGFYYQSASNASNSQTHVEGDIDFTNTASNPLNTGDPFSNALLGVYTSYRQDNAKPYASYLYHEFSGYVQDTWKIHPRVTLDLGIRLSWYQPVYNAVGDGAFFNPALFDPAKAQRIYRPVCVGASTCASGAATYRAVDPALSAPPSLANTLPSFYVGKLVPNSGDISDGIILASQGYPKGGINPPWLLPQPRLGLAWDVTGSHKTIVRGGFGITFDRYQSGITGFGATNPPLVLSPTLSNGYLQDITPGSNGALSPLTITGVNRNSTFPTVYSYSIGVQHNLGAATVVDISYVGSQSRNLARKTNLNALPYGVTFKSGAQDPTKYAGGVIPSSEPGLPSIYSAANLAFSGANALPVDYLRPYQGYSDITYYYFDADASYNSLQVEFRRRFTKGITFSAAYTFSQTKTTVSDDGTFTNLQNPQTFDYGLANFDRTHYFVGTFVWDLPKASGLVGGKRLAKLVMDGWTLSGNTSLASGSPTELGLSISGQDPGNRLLGSYSAANLSGQSARFLLNGSPQDGATINAAAFVVPGVGAIGPYPRFYLRNPGITNQDLSLFKNIPFDAEGKRYLQLRLEAFNIFNHPQFSGYNLATNIVNGAGQSGNAIFSNFTGLSVTNNIRPAGNTAVLGTYFGEYNAARDMRILQLAVKFYF
jgi:Carboxypeptidase regulatory-like domain/TonB-dependent Receptor Plug Domain